MKVGKSAGADPIVLTNIDPSPLAIFMQVATLNGTTHMNKNCPMKQLNRETPTDCRDPGCDTDEKKYTSSMKLLRVRIHTLNRNYR